VAIVEDVGRRLEFAHELTLGVTPTIQDYDASLLEVEEFRSDADSPSRIPKGVVRRTFLLGGPDEALRETQGARESSRESRPLTAGRERSSTGSGAVPIPYRILRGCIIVDAAYWALILSVTPLFVASGPGGRMRCAWG
jgi:hypothetical protein